MAVLWLRRGRFSPSSSVYFPYREGVDILLTGEFGILEGKGWKI